MSFIAFATEKDICNHLCKYKVGDTVKLYYKCQNQDGVFEVGTELKINTINLKESVLHNNILLSEIDNYAAASDAFDYELETTDDNAVKLCCNGKKL